MKIKSFDYFFDRDKGKKCLILGGAPSIMEIDYENFNGIIISMGDIPLRLQRDCQIDYWVNANSIFPIPDVDYEKINKIKNTTLLIAHSVTRKLNYSVIREQLNVPWFEYDQRHFGGRTCDNQIDSRIHLTEKQDCCAQIGNVTIQEFLQRKYKATGHYSSGATVAIHALSLAIILGCKKIYVGGVEIPIYAKDYNYFGLPSITGILKSEDGAWVINRHTIKIFFSVLFNLKIKSEFYPDVSEILTDFEYLNNICLDNNIELFNVSAKSNLNKIACFKYINPDKINLV